MKQLLMAVVTCAVWLWAAGASAQCVDDSECKFDRVCRAGACVDPSTSGGGCVRDTECKGDRICEDGQCVFPSASPKPSATATATAPDEATPAAAQPSGNRTGGIGLHALFGPTWYGIAYGPAGAFEGSIADGFMGHMDLMLSATFRNGGVPFSVGMGVRPMFGDIDTQWDIYFLRLRAALGAFAYGVGLGMNVAGDNYAFAFTMSLGLQFPIGDHLNIFFDILDMRTLDLYDPDMGALTIQSLVGFMGYLPIW